MAAAVVNRAAADFPAPAPAARQLPVSPWPRRSDTGDTGNPATAILATAELTDAAILAILANQEIGNERFDSGEWRIEVYTNRNGRRYWNWRRRGRRGGVGNWQYGGRFDSLSDERQAQYWQRAKNV